MSGSATLGRGSWTASPPRRHHPRRVRVTEAAPVALNALGPGASTRRRLSSVSRCLGSRSSCETRTARRSTRRDPGRLFIRGANLFSGYWPDGADGPDEDGWFGTGDIAVADDAGQLRLVGRSSDLVIVNGFNVYPAEVEAVLAAEAGVAEVAVVGVRHERTGEAVQAYVVPTAGTRARARAAARRRRPQARPVQAAVGDRGRRQPCRTRSPASHEVAARARELTDAAE